MENMSYEIVEAIESAYFEDSTLVRDCLTYMYKTTKDKEMQKKIEEWFDLNNYCINCGTKLQSYEWTEDEEVFNCVLCPICNEANIKKIKETE